MDMSMQQLLFVTALLAFATGAVLAGVSLRYYVTNDIREVRRELGGHARRQACQRGRMWRSLGTLAGLRDERGHVVTGLSEVRASKVSFAGRGTGRETRTCGVAADTGLFRITKEICLCEARGGVVR